MPDIPFALYDAFSDTAFGGSQAGIVSDASNLSPETMQRIVRELGLPAIAFVLAADGQVVSARFQSTVMELPMCGHGTIGLMTFMVEQGIIHVNGGDEIRTELRLPSGPTSVTLNRRHDGRPLVMLDVQLPRHARAEVDPSELARLLGLSCGEFSLDLPLETVTGDFKHLIVPVVGLAAMGRIDPDFAGLISFCHKFDLETVAAFSTEVERPENDVHVRDFCPAVGVAESAAAGTTNAAITSYLVRHGLARSNGDGQNHVQAEQGHEIQRPSAIKCVATMSGTEITRLQVGGVSTKVAEGLLHI